ncbi:MAG TPA: alpha/beta hydrolase, partial [Archangium sp.]
DPRDPLPLPAGVKCYAVAASLSAPGTTLVLGDGLVPISSALGEATAASHSLHFDDTLVVPGAGHLDLLDRPEVFARLDAWL